MKNLSVFSLSGILGTKKGPNAPPVITTQKHLSHHLSLHPKGKADYLDKEVDVFCDNYLHCGTSSLREVYKKGLWHQSAHAWIYNSYGEVVFQLRSDEIVNYPGRLAVSAGGGVDLGDTPQQAVIREVYEELGLEVSYSDLKNIGYRKCESQNEGRIYRVFDNLFVINSEVHLSEYKLQESELGGVFSVSVHDAIRFFNGLTSRIKMKGLVIKKGRLYKVSRYFTLQDFVPFRKEVYCKMLNIIETALASNKETKVTPIQKIASATFRAEPIAI